MLGQEAKSKHCGDLNEQPKNFADQNYVPLHFNTKENILKCFHFYQDICKAKNFPVAITLDTLKPYKTLIDNRLNNKVCKPLL